MLRRDERGEQCRWEGVFFKCQDQSSVRFIKTRILPPHALARCTRDLLVSSIFVESVSGILGRVV